MDWFRVSRVSQVPRPIPEATIGLIKKDHTNSPESQPGPERPRKTTCVCSNFASGGWGCPPDPHREGSAHGYTRAVPRCQGTSAGRSNLGVRHLERAARPSAFRKRGAFASNCTPFRKPNEARLRKNFELHTLSKPLRLFCQKRSLSFAKIKSCTPREVLHYGTSWSRVFFIPKIVFT